MFYYCALFHTKAELTYPLYNCMGIQCLRIANRQEESVELLKAISEGCNRNFMSIGAHWMNDMPEWLPQFYILSHECTRRKYQLGAVNWEIYLRSAATCYTNVYLTLCEFGHSTYWPEVSFMELKGLEKPAYYLVWAATHIQMLFSKGIYCKIGAAPDLQTLAQREQQAASRFTLGTGRYYETSIHKFLDVRYIGEELRGCIIRFLESTDPDAELRDFLH